MVELHEVNIGSSYSDEGLDQDKVNKYIEEHNIDERSIISITYKNPRVISLVCRTSAIDKFLVEFMKK